MSLIGQANNCTRESSFFFLTLGSMLTLGWEKMITAQLTAVSVAIT